MAKEFSLDDVDFQTKETADIEELPYIKPSATVSVETLGFFEGDDVPADARMECDTDAPAAKSVKTAKSTKAADVKIAKLAGPKLSKKDQLKMSEVLAAKGKNNPELMLAGNQRSNRMKRLAMKKAKKESARRGSPTWYSHLYITRPSYKRPILPIKLHWHHLDNSLNYSHF